MGHAHHQTNCEVLPLGEDDWRRNAIYLIGFDLFNHGYYWEAHEAWESLWRLADGKQRLANYLKGLIKLAAAGVKARQGVLAGVASHASRAAELFELAAAAGSVRTSCGCDLDELARHARFVANWRPPPSPATSIAVLRVFPFALYPRIPGGCGDAPIPARFDVDDGEHGSCTG